MWGESSPLRVVGLVIVRDLDLEPREGIWLSFGEAEHDGMAGVSQLFQCPRIGVLLAALDVEKAACRVGWCQEKLLWLFRVVLEENPNEVARWIPSCCEQLATVKADEVIFDRNLQYR